jgi:hypothetical protein
MGKVVYAAAMSHVLYPDYYGKNVGPHGRRMVEELIAVVRDMGRDMLAAKPDALVVIADDHLNVFSFDAPRPGRTLGHAGKKLPGDGDASPSTGQMCGRRSACARPSVWPGPLYALTLQAGIAG